MIVKEPQPYRRRPKSLLEAVVLQQKLITKIAYFLLASVEKRTVLNGFSVRTQRNSTYQVMSDILLYYHPGKKEKAKEDLVLWLKWYVNPKLGLEYGEYRVEIFHSLIDWPSQLFMFKVASEPTKEDTSRYFGQVAMA